MTALALIGLLADSDGWSPHDGWGMGWMMAGMVLFWAVIILGCAWVIRGRFDHRSQRRDEAPLRVLDRRFAEGAISADDYQARRNVLTGAALPRPQGAGSPTTEGKER